MNPEHLRLANALLSLAVSGALALRLVIDWHLYDRNPVVRFRIATQVVFFSIAAYASLVLRSLISIAPDYLPYLTAALAAVLLSLLWPNRRH